MARDLRQNTATRVTVGPFLDKTDGITPETSLTVTSEKVTFVVDTAGVPTLVIDAAPTTSGGTNDMVHITGDDSGYYDLELTASQTNYVGRAALSINDVATHLPVFHEFSILPADVYDAKYAGTFATLANIVDGVWDEATSGHLVQGSFGEMFAGITYGTVAATASTTSITLSAGSSATDDFYNGALIKLVAGTGSIARRWITDYVGSTKVATVDTAISTDLTTRYVIV